MIFDESLNFRDHMSQKINKANKIVGIIRRSFRYLDNKIFLKLYKALVRPHLEFANVIWSPNYKKDILAIENVQRRASKLLPAIKDLSYPDRLKALKLPTLAYRRLRGDMVETFKITHNKYDRNVCDGILKMYKDDDSLRTNRGHSMKLYKQKSNKGVRQSFFSLRVVDMWNNLPQTTVSAPSVKCFEARLDKFWEKQSIKYNFQDSWKKVSHNYESQCDSIMEDEMDLGVQD